MPHEVTDQILDRIALARSVIAQPGISPESTKYRLACAVIALAEQLAQYPAAERPAESGEESGDEQPEEREEIMGNHAAIQCNPRTAAPVPAVGERERHERTVTGPGGDTAHRNIVHHCSCQPGMSFATYAAWGEHAVSALRAQLDELERERADARLREDGWKAVYDQADARADRAEDERDAALDPVIHRMYQMEYGTNDVTPLEALRRAMARARAVMAGEAQRTEQTP